eukprot:scaffold1478_cov257-Prasinococcus_capsulatus_cf.AAC.4
MTGRGGPSGDAAHVGRGGVRRCPDQGGRLLAQLTATCRSDAPRDGHRRPHRQGRRRARQRRQRTAAQATGRPSRVRRRARAARSSRSCSAPLAPWVPTQSGNGPADDPLARQHACAPGGGGGGLPLGRRQGAPTVTTPPRAARADAARGARRLRAGGSGADGAAG